MKIIIHAQPKQNPAEIHKALQKGYGIEHPEKISGYAAFFFNYGDVKATDLVASMMEYNQKFRDFVFTSIRSFQKEDYGLVAFYEWEGNVESKWITGGGGDMFGRYAFGTTTGMGHGPLPERIIKIRYYEKTRTTYVLLDSEFDWLILEE